MAAVAEKKPKGTAREERLAAQKPSNVQVYYTRKGKVTMDFGRTKEGTIVPFTREVALRIDPTGETRPLKRINGNPVGKLVFSDDQPILDLDRSEKQLIEAITYGNFTEGSPHLSGEALLRVIDPQLVERERAVAMSDVKKALNAYLSLANDGEELQLLADALGRYNSSKADNEDYFLDAANKRPKEFLTYVTAVDEDNHQFKVVDKLRYDAVLNKAILLKVVEQGVGIVAFEGEKLGVDFRSAAIALQDNTPNRGKAHLFERIKEKVEDAGG